MSLLGLHPEDRRSPGAVLHRGCGWLFDPAELHRMLYSTRFGRVWDRAGYARFAGGGGEPVAVGLYAEHLALVYRDEPLGQYRVTYQPDRRRLQTVTPEHLCDTPYRSPQLLLWTASDDDTRPVRAIQPPLFPLEEVGA